ncbi:MAG: hypothetical protein HYV36_01850, partial [Lentisphaerae bacterium]|nr:hypothetical protein [Lentisphaerota bacterium]
VKIGKEIVESQVRNLGCAAWRLLAEHRPKDGWIAPNLNVTGRIADDFVRIAGSSWRMTFEEYRNGKKKYGSLPDWNELEKRES